MPTPSAPFNPLSGTSGDFAVGALSFTANTDYVTIPGSLPTRNSVAELGKWDFTVTINGAKFTGFNSPVDSTYGILWPLLLKGGIGDWSVDITGTYNASSTAGATSWLKFVPGSFQCFDLVFYKAVYGYYGLCGKVIDFKTGADHKQGENPDQFTSKIQGHGALLAPTFTA